MQAIPVFISWTSRCPLSEAMASALRDALPLVVRGARPWVSESDIKPGDHWRRAIDDNVAASALGVICITRRGECAAWLHFEAGALSQIKGITLVPLVVDLAREELPGPLSHLQPARAQDRGDMKRLFHRVNQSGQPAVRATEEEVDKAFNSAWPKFLRRITKAVSDTPAVISEADRLRTIEQVLSHVAQGQAEIKVQLADLHQARRQEKGRPDAVRED